MPTPAGGVCHPKSAPGLWVTHQSLGRGLLGLLFSGVVYSNIQSICAAVAWKGSWSWEVKQNRTGGQGVHRKCPQGTRRPTFPPQASSDSDTKQPCDPGQMSSTFLNLAFLTDERGMTFTPTHITAGMLESDETMEVRDNEGQLKWQREGAGLNIQIKMRQMQAVILDFLNSWVMGSKHLGEHRSCFLWLDELWLQTYLLEMMGWRLSEGHHRGPPREDGMMHIIVLPPGIANNISVTSQSSRQLIEANLYASALFPS